jgi:nucleoside-diphosphate-sugar epimerase
MPQDASNGLISLVTGGTGLLGSHIAERLVARGDRVRSLVRPTSDTRFLRELGVEVVEGDLTDPASCRRAMDGVSIVYHSAAKVGDWGSWPEFQTGCLDATENLARAAAEAKVERFVHISSTSAYGHPPEGGPPVDETAPLGQNLWPIWDYYTISKVECERILWTMAGRDGLRLSVIRPSWLYGERDRTTTERIVRRIRAGKVPLIGKGDNPLSAIYAGNVADAALLAAADPGSVGEAYNITSMGPITQREWFDLFADACDAPRPSRHVPYGLTFAIATAIEAVCRLRRRRRPPFITRYATWLMGRDLSYSTAKAEAKLGWRPAVGYEESIERTVRWYLDAARTNVPVGTAISDHPAVQIGPQ